MQQKPGAPEPTLAVESPSLLKLQQIHVSPAATPDASSIKTNKIMHDEEFPEIRDSELQEFK